MTASAAETEADASVPLTAGQGDADIAAALYALCLRVTGDRAVADEALRLTLADLAETQETDLSAMAHAAVLCHRRLRAFAWDGVLVLEGSAPAPEIAARPLASAPEDLRRLLAACETMPEVMRADVMAAYFSPPGQGDGVPDSLTSSGESAALAGALGFHGPVRGDEAASAWESVLAPLVHLLEPVAPPAWIAAASTPSERQPRRAALADAATVAQRPRSPEGRQALVTVGVATAAAAVIFILLLVTRAAASSAA